jgi:tetratricopeptide (TPR) repeat protein
MRDYDEEPPMLRYLDNLFKRFSVVVTYNGKSFDVPLLRSRFISNRMRFRLDATTHLDLVHVSRRLWKQRLGDCSLGNIERNILGVHRVNDVPSAEIPQIWLDYLHTRDATKLARVFRHHETDIISLAALTGAVSKQLSAPDGEGFEHAEDRLSVLRLLMRRRKYEEAVSHGDNLLDSETDLSPTLRQECHELLALAHKRLEHWEDFERVWRRLLESFPSNMGAHLELAKHHEHRTREFPEAIRICKEALSILEVREGIGRGFDVGELYHETFLRRLERIQGKMDRRATGLRRKPKKPIDKSLFEEQEDASDD